MAEPELPSRPAEEGEPQHWERRVLGELLRSAVDEQRRRRRWSILFRSLGFLWLFGALVLGFMVAGGKEKPVSGRHTALVELSGVIAADTEASADRINAGLQEAFKDSDTAGVILRVNSPGGSPVQAGQINAEIRRLRGLHPRVPLYVVVEDVCASGGYYAAAAADRIYVDQASMVGSIGVLMDGFGFTGIMDKLGVERRLLTAGEHKGFLDPFSPVSTTQRAYAQRLLDEVHQQFITVVRSGRGARLKNDPELFSGLVWSGQRSIELGLADALGTVDSVARDVIKAEDIVDYTPRENLAERVARRFGAAATQTLLGAGYRLR